MTEPELIEADLGPYARGYFTTRGVGAPAVSVDNPYAGADLALHVGDDPDRVGAHRAALAARVGLSAEDLAWMNQVHSTIVSPARRGQVPTADGLLVDRRPGRTADSPRGAAVLVADCVPLLLASPDGRLVAAVHAGRRGMLEGIVTAAVRSMAQRGVEPSELWAAIGPSICGRCYEVGQQMYDEAVQAEPFCGSRTRWDTPGLNVSAGVQAQLRRAGVKLVSTCDYCTFEDPTLYSYRRDGLTGRIAGVAIAR